jgi:sialic acid synthase SpsE/RimJ/RimL family protein N-acetyltransferase
MPVPEVRIGHRLVGPGRPVYFVAEAGSNHDGKLGQARRLIEVAARAGADAVKFQTFRAEKLYPRSAGMTDYLKVPRPIFDIIRDLEMPTAWIGELAAYAADLGLDFLSTPFDEASADALDPYVPAFKIASYEMTHHPLVQHCARKGKPLIVSTGTADLREVREMVEAVRAVGGEQLVLLQCTAKYPAPLGALNLQAMTTMARELGVPVGLSDHSREPLPGPMAAAALGACVIEKHFTLSNALPGPDHPYALEPEELSEVIRSVRQVERTLGSGMKVPQVEEDELRRFARRSVFTTRTVRAGEPLTVENLAVLRCGKLASKLPPSEFVRMLGRAACHDLQADTAVAFEDARPLELADGPVRLRPLAPDDAELVVSWRSRPEIIAAVFSAAAPTLREHQQWFRELERRSDRLEFVILDDARPVGTIGLSGIDLGARQSEYGILIGEPAARGRGVATRASRALLRFAFEALGLQRIWLELFTDNRAARCFYDRLGFVETTVAAPPRLKDGTPRAVTRMLLDYEGWRGRETA